MTKMEEKQNSGNKLQIVERWFGRRNEDVKVLKVNLVKAWSFGRRKREKRMRLSSYYVVT